jgi:hypothetical protein
MIDVRLDTLPQDLPWSTIGRRLVCKECGAAELVRRRVRALGGAGRLCQDRRRVGRWSVSKAESHVFQCLVNGTAAPALSCQFGTMFTEPAGWPDLYRETQRSLPVHRQGLSC